MHRFFNMYIFHIKQYAHNSYFFWLVITSTISILMLKYVAAYADNQLLNSQDVIGAGIFGMWSSAVTSAGILHFQRSQGVLVYLVNSPTNTFTNIIALVSSASTFGLTALPLSYILTGILNNGYFPVISIIQIGLILLFWFSALPITYVVAEIFLLTKNAFIYEELFVIPVLIFSGLLSINKPLIVYTDSLSFLIPITYPVHLLMGYTNLTVINTILWVLTLSVWLLAAYVIFKKIMLKIRITGELEAM